MQAVFDVQYVKERNELILGAVKFANGRNGESGVHLPEGKRLEWSAYWNFDYHSEMNRLAVLTGIAPDYRAEVAKMLAVRKK